MSELAVRLAHLLELRGIGLVTGDSGSGKTSACRRMAAELHQGLYKVLYVPLSLVVEGTALPTLVVDPERRRALIAVDGASWSTDAGTWQRAFRAHNKVRIGGWRLLRLPSSWHGTERIEEVKAQLGKLDPSTG